MKTRPNIQNSAVSVLKHYCVHRSHIHSRARSYLYIEVDDINEAVKDLKAKNIRCLSPEPRIGAHGKPVMFLHPKDCAGVLVELEQV